MKKIIISVPLLLLFSVYAEAPVEFKMVKENVVETVAMATTENELNIPLEESPEIEEEHILELPEQKVKASFWGTHKMKHPELHLNEYPIEMELTEDSVWVKPKKFQFGSAQLNKAYKIQYALPKKTKVTLKVLNGKGEEVLTLVEGKRKSAHYEVRWIPLSQKAGEYAVHFQAGDFERTNIVPLK